MTLKDLRIAVVGAGALGSACAAELSAAGARVVLFDPDPTLSASAVAAGMIAPAFESALEDVGAERAALWRAGRDAWPDFAERHGIALHRDGAGWIGPAEPLASRLSACDFAFVATADGLFTPEDWRLEPAVALAALSANVDLAAHRVDRLLSGHSGVEVEADGRVERFDAAVLAAGRSAEPPRIDGEGASPVAALMAAVQPVRGQILTLGGPACAAVEGVVRGPGVYLVPAGNGRLLVGATMEPGRADLTPDPAATERLRRAAEALVPALAEAELESVRVGLRGAFSDGLPAAGATAAPRLFAALGPRRNGWLLAPLVAHTVAAALAREPFAAGAAFDPRRPGIIRY